MERSETFASIPESRAPSLPRVTQFSNIVISLYYDKLFLACIEWDIHSSQVFITGHQWTSMEFIEDFIVIMFKKEFELLSIIMSLII